MQLLRAGWVAVVSLAACGDNLGVTSELHFAPETISLKVGGSVRFQVVDADERPVRTTLEVIGLGAIDADGRYVAGRAPSTDTIRTDDPAAPGARVEATAHVTAYTGTIAELTPSSGRRASHAAVPLDDGTVLVVGSMSDRTIERFDPATRAFRPAGDLGEARWDLTATALPDGGVLIVGGRSAAQTSALALVHAGDRVEATGALAQGRYAHRAVALDGGAVLISGGLPATGPDVVALATVERYDPATRSFAATGAMAVPRSHHTATRLRDGRVLVVGGRDSTCVETCPQRFWASAELYDPSTGRFTPTGSMALARAEHTATLLEDGRVLIAGGTTPDLAGTDLADTVEAYDPSTGRFTVIGAMRARRSEHTATLLGDGRVLFANGRSEGFGTIATATMEAFDPRTGESVVGASPRVTRYRHTATRLPTGEVLIVGGTEGGIGLDRVELYE